MAIGADAQSVVLAALLVSAKAATGQPIALAMVMVVGYGAVVVIANVDHQLCADLGFTPRWHGRTADTDAGGSGKTWFEPLVVFTLYLANQFIGWRDVR